MHQLKNGLQNNGSNRAQGLKSAFAISIREEDEEEEEVTIDQVQEFDRQSQIDEQQYDIPETKGLLPPLPDEPQSIKSPKFDYKQPEFASDQVQASPRKANLSTKHALHGTPTQEYTHQFETPKTADIKRNLSGILASTANTETSTPAKEKSDQEEEYVDKEILNYSPAITIDERFEVSLGIPIPETDAPKTIEEKIKFYQEVQKQEVDEFNKTLNSLRNSGWMSERELYQLEVSKTENFNKWEAKIQILKQNQRLKKKSSSNSLSSTPHQSTTSPSSQILTSNLDEDYFQSPKRVQSHSNGSPVDSGGSRKLFGDIIRSPTLQSLEQKFSSLGMKQ